MDAEANKRVERRTHQRRNVNFVGIVMLGADAIPCHITNLSKSGACVRLHKSIRLPRGHTRLTCARFGRVSAEVVWQNGAYVGLKFVLTRARTSPPEVL